MKLMQSIQQSALVSGFKMVPCAHATCTRWLTQRHLSARSVGVKLLGRWYCSYSCFASAAADRLSHLLTLNTAPSNRLPRMPLALMLLSQGVLNHRQLKQATDEQKIIGEEMGGLLFRLRMIDEKELTAARAMQWGCPVFTVPNRMADTRIHIPLTLMKLHAMAPLHYVGATSNLLVGFVHGIEYGPLYAIEQIAGCKTQACFVTPSEFQTQLHGRERNTTAVPDELTFELVQSPAKMARIVCDYGALLNADEVAIARSGGYLWARLKSGGKMTDLLFKAE